MRGTTPKQKKFRIRSGSHAKKSGDNSNYLAKSSLAGNQLTGGVPVVTSNRHIRIHKETSQLVGHL